MVVAYSELPINPLINYSHDIALVCVSHAGALGPSCFGVHIK